MSNVKSYLTTAGALIKGDLAEVNAELVAGREKRGGVLWQVLTNLICYANNGVFAEGYSKKLAKQFKLDVCGETGLSEKQAAKYTESISAALGVRGVRKGLKVIEGLPAAAADGPKTVAAFLKAAEIETFNQFTSAVRTAPTPVEQCAKMLAKLTVHQREMAMERAAKLGADEDEE